MRIAMYTDTFYPSVNGVSTSIATLAQSLAEAGHHVFLQAPRPRVLPPRKHFHKNITFNFVRSINVKIYPDLSIGTGLPLSPRKIREFKPDVIHVHTPLSIGIEGALIAKSLGVPSVYTFHTYFMDPDAMRIIGIHNRQLAGLIQKGGWRFNNTYCRLFDAIIAPSEYVGKDLKQHRVAPPITVCPNMLSNDVFPKKISSSEKVKRLIFVGRLSPEKRVHLLLHAYARLRAKHPDLELLIIGDGLARHDLFDLSLELGIGDGVRWFGQIPHRELITERYYQKGDLFVFLSRFETQGLVTLEAMAHGLPVVATASRANREVIGIGGVVLSDTANEEKTISQAVKAIEKNLNRNVMFLRQKALEQANKYRIDNVLPSYLQLYEKLAEKKRAPAEET